MSGASVVEAGGATRHDRRKLRTRARLIEAARAVIGRKGADAATIMDITEAADVGFGTFYNHFASKEAILAAASAEAIEAHGAMLDHLTATIDDPAEVIAIAVRHTIHMVERDPIWAWFTVRVNFYQEQIDRGLGHRLARDVRRGLRSGRFPTTDLSFMTHAIGGVVWSATRGKLLGHLGADTAEEAAACVLRMLSLPAAEARRIAARPLPGDGQPERVARKR